MSPMEMMNQIRSGAISSRASRKIRKNSISLKGGRAASKIIYPRISRTALKAGKFHVGKGCVVVEGVAANQSLFGIV